MSKKEKGRQPMIKLLITGANSYIGNELMCYLDKAQIEVNVLDVKDANWDTENFNGIDTIVHVAGIVHKKKKEVSDELYFRINRDLTYKIAYKAKNEGVKHFIFLSTMAVYGLSGKIGASENITKDTLCNPTTAYGASKLQAEQLITELKDDDFKVTIIRPPMVYGKNAKGNYNCLKQWVKYVGISPSLDNQRSMIYIDNLCEVIEEIILNQQDGIICPQNKEYVSTKELMRQIANCHQYHFITWNWLNKLIYLLGKNINIMKKIFGNLTYSADIAYTIQKVHKETSFEESIACCEYSSLPYMPTEAEPLVSIITPMYNAEKYIKDTIECVLAQYYRHWEMLIVDDCSNDQGLTIANQYAAKDSRIKIIALKQNGGVANARNEALKNATGKYIAFLDSDDIWYPQKLSVQVRFMEDHQYAISYTRNGYINKLGDKEEKVTHIPLQVNYKRLLKGNPLHCLTVMINHQIIHTIEMPNIKHEDYATWLSILKSGFTAYGIDEELALYRKTATSVSANKFKAITWTWHIYRNQEHLNYLQTIKYFILHMITASIKHIVH